MQMASFDAGGNSVYLATMDSEARAKDFVIEPVYGIESLRYPVIYYGRRHRAFHPEPGERIYIEHYPDDMGVQGSDYPDHYPVAFGVYQGDWTEAAKTYRLWALQQKWTSKGALSNRIDIPESVTNRAVWIQDNRNNEYGTPKEMNKPLLEAAKQMDVPVTVHLDIPLSNKQNSDYLKFNNGFKERVEELQENNINVIPNLKGAAINLNSTDFDKFQQSAVKDEAGGLRFYFNSDKTGRHISMCGNQVQWQDNIESLVDEIKEQYGVNGIYLDRVLGLSHENCFDKSHLHPLGGGNYWTDGNRELLQKVKNVALRNGRNMVVTSEGASEVFFDKLDANLLLAQPSVGEIPMMQMVYSGYTIFVGSSCDYTKNDNYFRYAQGQAFIDGRQNGWMDLGLFKPENKEKIAYLKQCGKYRINTKKYLVYGQLIDPIIPLQKIETFTDNGFKQGANEKEQPANVPCAEARLWKSEEGTLAILFANYVDKEIAFPYQINLGDYGLSKGKWKIKEIGLKSSKNKGEFTDTLNRTEILEPGTIKIIELIYQEK